MTARGGLSGAALLALCWLPGAAGAADLGANLSVASEFRFRGRPVSAKRPAATLSLSYDGAKGGYAGLAAAAVIVPGEGPRLLAIEQTLGFARPLGSGPVLDAGIATRYYSGDFSGGYEAAFVEVYTGVSTRRWAAQLAASPSYYGQGRPTVYASVDAVQPIGRWRLTGHLGGLLPLGDNDTRSFVRKSYDWRIGVTREAGPVEFGLSWTGAGPRADFYRGRERGRSALIASATVVF